VRPLKTCVEIYLSLNTFDHGLMLKYSKLHRIHIFSHCFAHFMPFILLPIFFCFSFRQYYCVQNVNPTVALDWVSGLQRLILKKEEEIRAADRCRIQLQLPGKQDKYVFFPSPIFNLNWSIMLKAHNSSLQSQALHPPPKKSVRMDWFSEQSNSLYML